MDNEELFLMIEASVEHASKQLTSEQNLVSFAMVLEKDNTHRHINSTIPEGETRYENLLEQLRSQAHNDEVVAMALLSNVTIPENFNAAVSSGIRIHIEHKPSLLPSQQSSQEIHNKLSARLLYVPYQLYKTKDDDTINIQLHEPIPVSMASEIFI